jgi:hypothetical protein
MAQKIENARDFAKTAFAVLERQSKINHKAEKDLPELQTQKEYIFMSLLTLGYPAKIADNMIVLEGQLVGEDKKYVLPVGALEKHKGGEDLLADILTGASDASMFADKEEVQKTVDEPKNEPQAFEESHLEATSVEETEKEPANSQEATPLEDDDFMATPLEDDEVTPLEEDDSAKEKSAEQPVNNSNTIQIAEEEPKETGNVFNMEYEVLQEDGLVPERQLGDMWMIRKSFTMGFKDESNGYDIKEYVVTVLPFEIKKGPFPCNILAILRGEGTIKYGFSETTPSVTIPMEDTAFNITLLATQTGGKITYNLRVSPSNSMFQINTIDLEFENIGTYLPRVCGSKIKLGENETLELFPCSERNDEETGAVPCVYRHQYGEEVKEGLHQPEAPEFFTGDGNLIKLMPYWDTEKCAYAGDGNDVLKVLIQ